MTTWRYVTYGRVTHAFPDEPLMFSRALCGTQPSWYRGVWLGVDTQIERDRAASMPRCRRCANALAG